MTGALFEIVDTATGEVAWHQDSWINEDDSYSPTSEFIWTEGNYSCDCNRKLFFYRAKGLEASDEETPCHDGRKNQYKVTWVWAEDGEFYQVDS